MPKVFISHAHRDADLAAAIRQALKKLGVDVFAPAVDISPSSNWRTSVKSAMETADALVVVVGSPDAAASSWVTYEVGMAEASGKPILLLASQDFSLSDLPIELSDHTAISFDPAKPAQTARVVQAGLRAAA